jgi:hypothetical protein
MGKNQVAAALAFACITLPCCLYTMPSHAACEDALKQDLEHVGSSESVWFSVLNMISRSNFDEMKKQHVLEYLTPNEKIKGSFDSLNSWREDIKSKTEYSFASVQWSEYAASRLSASGAQAFVECLQKPGIKITLAGLGDREARVKVKFTASVGNPSIFVTLLFGDAKVEGEHPIAENGDVDFPVPRKKNETLLVTAQGTTKNPTEKDARYSYSSTISIPPDFEKLPKPPAVLHVGDVKYGDDGGTNCDNKAKEKVIDTCELRRK